MNYGNMESADLPELYTTNLFDSNAKPQVTGLRGLMDMKQQAEGEDTEVQTKEMASLVRKLRKKLNNFVQKKREDLVLRDIRESKT